jgi:hypothetical protein
MVNARASTAAQKPGLLQLVIIAEPRALTFRCTANWLDVDTAMEEHGLNKEFEIRVVPAQDFNKQERNDDIARTIADIWMARHGYDAMMLNEQGLYEEAAAIFDFDKERFAEMTAGLREAKAMRAQREVVREHSSSEWHGASKLEAMSMSRKAMHNKPDFRRKRRDSRWTDFNPDS